VTVINSDQAEVNAVIDANISSGLKVIGKASDVSHHVESNIAEIDASAQQSASLTLENNSHEQ